MSGVQQVKLGLVYSPNQATLVTSSGAYNTNDVVGGLLKLDIRGATKCGVITEITLIDTKTTPVSGAYTLHIYRKAPAVIANDAAFALLSTEIVNRLRKVSIAAGDYVSETVESGNSASYATKSFADNLIHFYAEEGYLYFYLQAGSTHNYGATNKLAMLVTYLELN